MGLDLCLVTRVCDGIACHGVMIVIIDAHREGHGFLDGDWGLGLGIPLMLFRPGFFRLGIYSAGRLFLLTLIAMVATMVVLGILVDDRCVR